MKYILTSIFILSLFSAKAGNYFEFSPKLEKAYKQAVSLQFKSAAQLIDEVKEEEPENVLVHYVENYIDFLKIYIDEDYEEFQRLEANKGYRLEKLKSGDSSSPYYLYTQAEVRLHWAVARVKFEEYRLAAFEVRKAYQFLEKNDRRFPNFMANKKSLGILHSLIGSIPPNFQWVVKLAGMSGTIEQGRAEIKEVVDYSKGRDFIFAEETIVMYALLILHIGNEGDGAWDIIRNSGLDSDKNPLASFAQASVAMHTGRSDDAISILQNRPKGKQYHPFHYMDYMLGLCKLYRQDADAGFYLNKYLINFKGRNYIKEGYQRLAWFELLNSNETAYWSNMKKCITKGKASIDGDKRALKAAQNGEKPNIHLLRARLQFDGGYADNAIQTMNDNPASTYDNDKDVLEYHYRKGRIYQSQKKYDSALAEFQEAISKGKDKPYYFACNAALQSGIIYENQKNYNSSRSSYNQCLDMRPSDYKTSLHGKAKAGLNRIKGK